MSRFKRVIYTADCETDPFKRGRVPSPFIWGLYDGENPVKYFYNTDSFVDYVSNLNAIVYAHNGGKFDWFYILHRLDAFEPLLIINGRLAKFKIGRCEFRDSYNILPEPLSSYQKDDFDYTILERNVRYKQENWITIKKYLANDCIYLHEFISKFIAEYGRNITLASSAMKYWGKLSKIPSPSTSRFFYESMKPYYYGGRVEVFKHGEINNTFKLIDINSAYPYAMSFDHPYGDTSTMGDKLPETIDEIQRSFITLTSESTGVFPFRDKLTLSFPNDGYIREFNITGWEYLAAKELGLLKNYNITTVITFDESINFTEYVNHFFDAKDKAKKSGDKAGYIMSKLLMNSLYGKYGANSAEYKEYMTVDKRFIEACENDGYSFCAELPKHAIMQKPLDEKSQRYYNVAVAASITGFVRAYLIKNIHRCENVYYCDTDSIVCDSYDDSIIGSELGKFACEGTFDYGAIAGKKMYAFKYANENKYKTACKGAKLTPKEIIKIALGAEIIYKPENPTFSLRNGIDFIDRKIKATFGYKVNEKTYKISYRSLLNGKKLYRSPEVINAFYNDKNLLYRFTTKSKINCIYFDDIDFINTFKEYDIENIEDILNGIYNNKFITLF
jgi:DNA polymerase type B, organellar and viral